MGKDYLNSTQNSQGHLTMIKYCTDCKHFQPDSSFQDAITAVKFGHCLKYLEKTEGNYHLISTELAIKPKPRYANVARCESFCGEAAIGFEPREEVVAEPQVEPND
jgi:hypothetical protein